jgi:hypothetical protein
VLERESAGAAKEMARGRVLERQTAGAENGKPSGSVHERQTAGVENERVNRGVQEQHKKSGGVQAHLRRRRGQQRKGEGVRIQPQGREGSSGRATTKLTKSGMVHRPRTSTATGAIRRRMRSRSTSLLKKIECVEEVDSGRERYVSCICFV